VPQKKIKLVVRHDGSVPLREGFEKILPGAKYVPGGRDDGDPDVRVVFDVGIGILNFFPHGEVDSVFLIGPVQGEPCDVIFYLVPYRLLCGHAGVSS